MNFSKSEAVFLIVLMLAACGFAVTDTATLTVEVVSAGGILLDKGSASPMRLDIIQGMSPASGKCIAVIYTLDKNEEVELGICDSEGRRMNTLVNEIQGPGLHQAMWRLEGASRNGLYFVVLRHGAKQTARKLAWVR